MRTDFMFLSRRADAIPYVRRDTRRYFDALRRILFSSARQRRHAAHAAFAADAPAAARAFCDFCAAALCSDCAFAIHRYAEAYVARRGRHSVRAAAAGMAGASACLHEAMRHRGAAVRQDCSRQKVQCRPPVAPATQPSRTFNRQRTAAKFLPACISRRGKIDSSVPREAACPQPYAVFRNLTPFLSPSVSAQPLRYAIPLFPA